MITITMELMIKKAVMIKKLQLSLKLISQNQSVTWQHISQNWSVTIRERQQLGFGNLVVNLKPTHLPHLNGKGQFTFLKTKSSHSDK